MKIQKYITRLVELYLKRKDSKDKKIEKSVKRGVKEYEETFRRLAQA